jgi:hypothetical protein
VAFVFHELGKEQKDIDYVGDFLLVLRSDCIHAPTNEHPQRVLQQELDQSIQVEVEVEDHLEIQQEELEVQEDQELLLYKNQLEPEKHQELGH